MRRSLCAFVVLAGLVQASTAAAASGSVLTPRLQELARPSIGEAAPARQADTLDLPRSGGGSLQYDGDKVIVTVRFGGNAAAAKQALAGAGASVMNVSGRYQLVTAAVAPADLDAVAGVPGVLSVAEALAPELDGWSQQTCQGATTSGGDAQLRAGVARHDYSVNGAGVKVGVISDSYAASTALVTETDDVNTGDLPGPGNLCGFLTPVQNLHDPASGTDEGRGMAKIVHDIAPGATLAFATANPSQAAFASNIADLKAHGASVIVDDITYFDEPFFQDGPIANAVNTAVAGGATYLSAAGNANNRDSSGRDIGGYEASYRPTACPAPPAVPAGGDCMDFDPGAGVDNTLDVNGTGNLGMILGWSLPWNGVNTDYDLYILDGSGNQVAKSENVNATTGEPFEFASTGSGAHQIVVKRVAGTGTPRFRLRPSNGAGLISMERPTSSGTDFVGRTLFGHKGTTSVFSVAAASFDDNTAPEPYSSRGPTTLVWNPVPSTTLLASPVTVNKPDFVASDCAADTFFSSNQFCGTSAAAPHAAGVVALIKQAKPGVTTAQILNALKSTARPMGLFGPTAIGSGLIDAAAAIASLGVPLHAGDSSAPFFSTTGSITTADPTQTGRLNRSGGVSACGHPRSTFVASPATQFHYDRYPFQNLTDAAQCVRVQTSPAKACTQAGASLLTAGGYLGSFDASNPIANFGGYIGYSPITTDGAAFFMPVAPGQAFAVAVNEVTANAGCPSYRLTLDSSKPFATAPPVVSGPSTAGVATTTSGAWAGAPAFSYHWQRCTAGGTGCADIAGGTHATYTTAQADVGSRLRARVTATEHGQSASVTSGLSAVVPPLPPPNTRITAGPKSRTTSGTAKFSFSSTQSGSTFVCRIDKKPAGSCRSPKTYKGLKSGKHTFRVVAKNGAGRSDPSPASSAFTVVGPQTKLKSGPKKVTHSRTAKFSFKSSQKKSSFRCQLDKGKPKKCKSPKTYRHLKKGKHTLRIYAVNKSGVRDPSPSKKTWRIK